MMRTRKLVIPRVAVAGLVLGGCGGADGDSAATSESIAAVLCDATLLCDEGEFYRNYDSVDACASETASDIDLDAQYYGELDGDACRSSFLAYYDCYADEYAESCGAYATETTCRSEIADMVESCPSWYDTAY